MRRKTQLQTGSHGTAKVPRECWWAFDQNHSGRVTRMALPTRHFRFRKCAWNEVPLPFVFGCWSIGGLHRLPWIGVGLLILLQ
jgi:hypothetical protein